MAQILGIDLGTTFSAAAYIDPQTGTFWEFVETGSTDQS